MFMKNAVFPRVYTPFKKNGRICTFFQFLARGLHYIYLNNANAHGPEELMNYKTDAVARMMERRAAQAAKVSSSKRSANTMQDVRDLQAAAAASSK